MGAVSKIVITIISYETMCSHRVRCMLFIYRFDLFEHRSKLSKEILPVLKQSVQILKKRLDAHILHARSPGSIRTTVSEDYSSRDQ